MEEWIERWDVSSWREYLAAEATESERVAVRQHTHTGRPLGTEEFVHELEEATKRPLTPQRGGRPTKDGKDERQRQLVFEP